MNSLCNAGHTRSLCFHPGACADTTVTVVSSGCKFCSFVIRRTATKLRQFGTSRLQTNCGRRAVIASAGRQRGVEEPRKKLDDIDVSVFRFTLGIPGFDDTDLPRVVGIVFGAMILLNHAFSLSSATQAQLRIEAIGLLLAAVSIALPGVSRVLDGTRAKAGVKVDQEPVFALAENFNEVQKKELAWSTYTLLRNTETLACLVWMGDEVICARGFWGVSASGGGILSVLGDKMRSNNFLQLKEPLYISSNADRQSTTLFPPGTASLMVQPFSQPQGESVRHGFVLTISNIPQAYKRKDRVWIEAIAQKLAAAL